MLREILPTDVSVTVNLGNEEEFYLEKLLPPSSQCHDVQSIYQSSARLPNENYRERGEDVVKELKKLLYFVLDCTPDFESADMIDPC